MIDVSVKQVPKNFVNYLSISSRVHMTCDALIDDELVRQLSEKLSKINMNDELYFDFNLVTDIDYSDQLVPLFVAYYFRTYLGIQLGISPQFISNSLGGISLTAIFLT